jgi:hypothetical protein
MTRALFATMLERDDTNEAIALSRSRPRSTRSIIILVIDKNAKFCFYLESRRRAIVIRFSWRWPMATILPRLCERPLMLLARRRVGEMSHGVLQRVVKIPPTTLVMMARAGLTLGATGTTPTVVNSNAVLTVFSSPPLAEVWCLRCGTGTHYSQVK